MAKSYELLKITEDIHIYIIQEELGYYRQCWILKLFLPTIRLSSSYKDLTFTNFYI